MVKNFETLVALCDEELCHREYLGSYYARLLSHWEKLRIWLTEQNITEFSEEVGNNYLEAVYGTHLLPVKPSVKRSKFGQEIQNAAQIFGRHFGTVFLLLSCASVPMLYCNGSLYTGSMR